MNEQFEYLPEDKQERILNAALEIFSKYDYKHASTEEIASKAGISKGMLFYYFHNKKSLYLYLYDYCEKMALQQVCDEAFYSLDDYFDIWEYSARKKAKIIEKNPYFMDFAVRAFYSAKEDVSEELQKTNTERTGQLLVYFKNADLSKFVEGTDIEELTHMLLWMTDGYMNEKRRSGLPIKSEELMNDFHRWINMFRSLVYKKEYMHGGYDGTN